jgi:hypothetical protein
MPAGRAPQQTALGFMMPEFRCSASWSPETFQ